MFSKNRQKRFAIVSMLPLLLLGLWLASGGTKSFVPSHYSASCSNGKCLGWASEQAMNPREGVFLGNPFSGGARLEGDLAAWIIRDGAVDPQFLSIRAVRPDALPCSLTYTEKLEEQSLVGGALKTIAVIKDVFHLECGNASVANFRFADRALQIGLVDALIENADNRAAFDATQKRISMLSFFAPFAAFGLLWILALLLHRAFAYVWYGSAKGRKE